MDSTDYPNLESNLQITVKGASEEMGQNIGNAVASVLRALIKADQRFDLRRMHRVIITTDFAGELAEQSKATVSGNAIGYTNEEYAQAVAKVLLLPRGSEIEILPIFNAHLLVPLTQDTESDDFRFTLHLLHHEFCHVHDDNKKLDAFPEVWLKHRYSGKDIFVRPLAEVCWSEYAANRMSASTATETAISNMTGSLASAIERTKSEINRAILAYRRHGDLNNLMTVFGRHGEFLPKSAAYVLGYMDGLDKSLEALSPTTSTPLTNSYFEESWNEIHAALRHMWEVYPTGWGKMSVYDDLAGALENYYATMGLILSTTDDGRAYVHVPFRPETTPML